MNPLLHLIPLGVAAVLWFGVHRLNQRRHWFRIGEVIFWDVILLILVFLIWLRWV